MKKKRIARPLLVATAGITLLGLGACGGIIPGNPLCPNGDPDLSKCQPASADGGTRDGGP